MVGRDARWLGLSPHRQSQRHDGDCGQQAQGAQDCSHEGSKLVVPLLDSRSEWCDDLRNGGTNLVNRKNAGVLALLLLPLMACGRASNPDTTIKRAYDWYVEMVRSAQNPWQRAPIDLKPLVTQRFLSSIENTPPDLDGSGMVDGHNVDARLAIEDVNINGAAATARVMVVGRMIGRQMLSVYLVKEDRSWKIDDVKLIDSE